MVSQDCWKTSRNDEDQLLNVEQLIWDYFVDHKFPIGIKVSLNKGHFLTF